MLEKYNIDYIANETGIPKSTLYRWKKSGFADIVQKLELFRFLGYTELDQLINDIKKDLSL